MEHVVPKTLVATERGFHPSPYRLPRDKTAINQSPRGTVSR